MPAKDHYHDTVKRALLHDGWEITDEQYKVTVGVRRLWIDMRATKGEQNLAILVEVKGFENAPSLIEELANVVGQYVLYQLALKANNIEVPLFLAVPVAAFQGILSEELGKQAIQHVGMKVVVFEPEREEIVQWIP